MAGGPFGQALQQGFADPSLGDQPVNESPDDILLRLFTQYAQEKAPTPPPTHLGPGQLFGLAMSGPLRNLVLQNMLNKQPGMQEYQQQEAQYKSHQQALGDISSMAGNVQRGQQFAQREGRLGEQADMRRWIGGSFQTVDPNTHVNYTVPVWRDKMTGKMYNSDRSQEINEMALPSPVKWTIQYDEFGNALRVPTSELPQQGSAYSGMSAGAPGITPVPTEGGGQTSQPSNVINPNRPQGTGTRNLGFKKTPGANLQGIQQQLDNSELMLNEMKDNWLKRPPEGWKQAAGTAGANILSRGVGADLGLSGVASMIDQHAVIHERDRNAIATTLSFPLSGSRRGMEGARQSLLGIIPHYTDPPEVWEAFERQMRQFIANSRRMPWGDDPEASMKQYEQSFDMFLTQTASTAAGFGRGPYSGKALPRTIYNQMSPSDQQLFTNGGGKVTD